MRQRDSDILRRCEGFHTAARSAWGRRFLGRAPRRTWVAAGTEVTDQRDYVTGDDIRYIDWNRAARLDEFVTRQFHGGAPQRVEMLVDVSASMAIGGHSKFELAKELAAVLGYFALADFGSLRLTGFGQSEASRSQWLHGRQCAPTWLRVLSQLPLPAGSGSLASAAQALVQDNRGGNLVVVLSDLLQGEGFEAGLGVLLRAGREVRVVQIVAPEDADPQLSGAARLFDVESAGEISTELNDRDTANYREVFADFSQSVRHFCRRYGVVLTQVRSDLPLNDCVRRLTESVPLTAAAG